MLFSDFSNVLVLERVLQLQVLVSVFEPERLNSLLFHGGDHPSGSRVPDLFVNLLVLLVDVLASLSEVHLDVFDVALSRTEFLCSLLSLGLQVLSKVLLDLFIVLLLVPLSEQESLPLSIVLLILLVSQFSNVWHLINLIFHGL